MGGRFPRDEGLARREGLYGEVISPDDGIGSTGFPDKKSSSLRVKFGSSRSRISFGAGAASGVGVGTGRTAGGDGQADRARDSASNDTVRFMEVGLEPLVVLGDGREERLGLLPLRLARVLRGDPEHLGGLGGGLEVALEPRGPLELRADPDPGGEETDDEEDRGADL